MEEKGQEKRRFPRLKTELLVRYKILEAPKEEISDAKTKNISAGGICLVAREKINPGSILMLEIRFPKSDEAVVAYGRVIWSQDSALGLSPAGHMRFDNGIEFEEITDSDRERIKQHIKLEQEKLKDDWKIGIVKDLSSK